MSPWQRHLLTLAAATGSTLMLFGQDVHDMAIQWWMSSTYGHCLFVLPIVGWLVWLRRDAVARMMPGAWWPGLGIAALAALIWMLGEAASLALVRQAALVLMIQASILVLLGPPVARALLFPIFYLVFLIPFGDEFVPALQLVTARMTMVLLHAAQVPAHLDGVFITTPAGWFEVAEACSGVKFLMAMIAYGALIANVCFKRWHRRVAFMLLCVAAPVIANGIRASATIYAAQLTNAETATGFDHIVYGWFFFALVLLVVIAVARPFFDRSAGDPLPEPIASGSGGARPLVPTALAMMALLAVPTIWSNAADARQTALPHRVKLPEIAGWTQVSNAAGYPWVPQFDGADHRLYGRYRSVQGHHVDLAIALYASQGRGREIVAYGQGAVDPASKWAWAGAVAGPRGAKAERLLGPGKVAREALTFYVVDGRATGDVMTVKWQTLRARLLRGDQNAAVVIISAEGDGRREINRFLGAFGPVDRRVEQLLTIARGR